MTFASHAFRVRQLSPPTAVTGSQTNRRVGELGL
jgi:hypothetical protein